VFGGWIVFAVAIVLIANAAGRPTSNDTTIPGSDSTRATDLLEQKLPAQANGSVPIVLDVSSGKLTEGANKAAVQQTVKALKANRYVHDAISPLSQQGSSSLAENDTLGFISVFLKLGAGDLDDDEANEIFAAADPARDAGIEVSAGGYLGTQLSEPSTRLSEIVGIVAAMIVLVFVLGTVLAMSMPIATAVIGVISGLAVIGAAGTAIAVPSIAPTLAVMLGLGVGVDYSLFIVTRHRRLLADGQPVHEAVARAVATSGGAVLFAGGTVVLSLLCLYFGGIPQVRELGYSAAIGVAVVIVAALTLLPAGLALLGHRINRLRVRSEPRQIGSASERPGGWARWGSWIGRHPLLAALSGALVLLALSIPVLEIRLGAQDNGQMPSSTTIRQAYDELSKGFGVGVNGPLLVAVDVKPPAKPDTKKLNQLQEQQTQQQQAVEAGEAPPPTEAQQQQAQQQEKFLSSPASDPRLVKLENKVSKANDVEQVSPISLNDAGTAAAFSAIPGSAPSAERTQDLVNELRDSVIPKALEGTEMTAYVGGTTAANIDLADKIGEKLPLVIVIIVGLSFVLLTLAFRTVVVPALAAAMNLLAVAAAYGVLVAIFQKGWGVELIGLDHAVPIVSFVPLMMFAILFGLSTDYTVFLLTRISEEFDRHGDHRQAIVDGLGRAARVIIAAAVIMVLVFASFIINGNPTVKQFGVGLAAAVAVDALIVCMVLPGLMLLVGRACWWLPGPIERHLPPLGIEGDEYFKGRDAAPSESAPAETA
jgi:RND superfamily putative drug exporter